MQIMVGRASAKEMSTSNFSALMNVIKIILSLFTITDANLVTENGDSTEICGSLLILMSRLF